MFFVPIHSCCLQGYLSSFLNKLLTPKIKCFSFPWLPGCDPPPSLLQEEPCWPGAPPGCHCSELFMVSTGTRSRLSGDIFIYHVRRFSSSPPLLSPPRLLHLWRMLSALGGLLFLRSYWPPVSLCRSDVRPRRPCSAEWTEQPV